MTGLQLKIYPPVLQILPFLLTFAASHYILLCYHLTIMCIIMARTVGKKTDLLLLTLYTQSVQTSPLLTVKLYRGTFCSTDMAKRYMLPT